MVEDLVPRENGNDLTSSEGESEVHRSSGLVVFGSRVRDVSVDINLPNLYQVNPGLREVIRFDGNDPCIRRNTLIVARHGTKSMGFRVQLEGDQAVCSPKHGSKYQLKPGSKYQLVAPGGEIDPKNTIELPCQSITWGGGGINLARAVRGMSSARRTTITYVDTGRTISQHGNWNLAKKIIVDMFPRDLQSSGANVPLDSLLDRHLVGFEQRGEKSWRNLAQLFSTFNASENIEMDLTQHEIDFALFRQAKEPSPKNLVISGIRDASRMITDKIIFKGVRALLEEGAAAQVIEFLDREVKDPTAIVINTVYDRELFAAAIKWAVSQQKIRPGLPVLLCMTAANFEHTQGPHRTGLLRNLFNLKPLYVILNEEEFASLASQIKNLVPDGEELKGLLAKGLLPDRQLLGRLIKGFTDYLKEAHERSFIVTFGPQGSIGVTMTRVFCMGSYSLPERHIYGTSGCGDAFAAGVALVLAHWKEAKSGLEDSEKDKPTEALFRRMMAVGSASAYARATSPVGQVTSHEVQAILRNAYLPTETPGAIDAEVCGGPFVLPTHAERWVQYSEFLAKLEQPPDFLTPPIKSAP